MKKWISGFFILLVLLTSSIYIFFPNNLVASKATTVNCSIEATYRYIGDNKHWSSREAHKTEDTLRNLNICDKYNFSIYKKKYRALDLTVGKNQQDTLFHTKMVFLELKQDSVAIEWRTSYTSGFNPIIRISKYLEAISMKKCMTQVMARIKSDLENVEIVYGFNIQYTTLKDSVLVSVKDIGFGYPTSEKIYSMVHKLKEYIKSHGARATNYPMLNIVHNGNSSYLTMVAIATDRALEGNNEISLKRLLQIPNKTLTTEVKGGRSTIQAGFTAIETFMTDFYHSSPVIPFQLLITDRRIEKDSTKWITQLYYPIM